jgi:hypothetical protein
MAIKVQNATDQTIPVILPGPNGGQEKRIAPRETVVLLIDKPTAQIRSLIGMGYLKQR